MLDNPDSEEFTVLFASIRRSSRPTRPGTRPASSMKGVTEEPPPACIACTRCTKRGELKFPAINVNDSVTKSKFDNLYGCRESLVDGIRRATDVMIAGKIAVVCGYGDVGKGSASAARPGARVWSPRSTRSARCRRRWKATASSRWRRRAKADIFVTATGNFHVIDHHHLVKMKDNAIVCKYRPLRLRDQRRLDRSLPVGRDRRRSITSRFPRQPHHPAREGSPQNLGCGTGHPSYVMLVLRQPDDRPDRAVHEDGRVPVGVHAAQAPRREGRPSAVEDAERRADDADRGWAKYIGVPMEGQYKTDHYRY